MFISGNSEKLKTTELSNMLDFFFTKLQYPFMKYNTVLKICCSKILIWTIINNNAVHSSGWFGLCVSALSGMIMMFNFCSKQNDKS